MERLRLDYLRGMRPFPWAGAILFIAALTALTLAGAYYRELFAELVPLEKKAGHAAPLTQAAAEKERATPEMAQEIKHANEVLEQLALPWGKLFQAIESSSIKQVALLAMEPDAEKHVVKISGEAKNITATLNYIKKLAAQEVFSSVYLQSHQTQQQDPEKPVRFTLVAAWRVMP